MKRFTFSFLFIFFCLPAFGKQKKPPEPVQACQGPRDTLNFCVAEGQVVRFPSDDSLVKRGFCMSIRYGKERMDVYEFCSGIHPELAIKRATHRIITIGDQLIVKIFSPAPDGAKEVYTIRLDGSKTFDDLYVSSTPGDNSEPALRTNRATYGPSETSHPATDEAAIKQLAEE